MTKSELIYFLLGGVYNKTLRESIANTENDDIISVLISQSIYNFNIIDNKYYIIGKRKTNNQVEFL